MKCSTAAVLLLGTTIISCMFIQTANGFTIRNETSLEDEEAAIMSAEQDYGSYDSGESAIVQLIGNNDENQNEAPREEYHHHGVGGFFRRLGCDIWKGTQIVTKSVKNGYSSVKKFFSRRKEYEAEPEKGPGKELEVNKIDTVVVSASSTESIAVPQTTEIIETIAVSSSTDTIAISSSTETIAVSSSSETIEVPQSTESPIVHLTESSPVDNEIESADPEAAPEIDVRILGFQDGGL